MRFIAHRRNSLQALRETPVCHGVEVDVRSCGDRLILSHEPYERGEPFSNWIAEYHHGTLILNVKEEGLEEKLLACMRERGISDFFFLDQSFPYLVKTSLSGERRSAVRVSEFESLETALALAGRVDWVWVDSFSRFPLNQQDWLRLKDAGFRLCLVSPELLGRVPQPEIRRLRAEMAKWGVEPDAVCAKLETIPDWTGA
jgi:hypothetical protein